jgi:hypothetical protein
LLDNAPKYLVEAQTKELIEQISFKQLFLLIDMSKEEVINSLMEILDSNCYNRLYKRMSISESIAAAKREGLDNILEELLHTDYSAWVRESI